MFQQNVFQGPGTGTFSTHTFEIIFRLLVAGLIGLWLGWVLWSKYRQTAERLQTENISLNATMTALRQESEELKTQNTDLESERATLENRVQSLSWEADTQRNQFTILQSDFEKLLARNRQLEAELGMSLEPDVKERNMELEIEEVGEEAPSAVPSVADSAEDTPAAPEASETETPSDVAETDEPTEQPVDTEPLVAKTPDDVTFIAPVSRESMIPISELGNPPVPPAAPETEAEPLVVAAVTDGPRDDLKIVEGIGPKIEQLLFKAGVTTYGQLAATSVQQLKDILVDAGSRYAMHDPGTWSAQALLAANGEWENLKAYQDFLNAGKRPDKN